MWARVYIYIYIERERETRGAKQIYIYIYIFIYIDIHIYIICIHSSCRGIPESMKGKQDYTNIYIYVNIHADMLDSVQVLSTAVHRATGGNVALLALDLERSSGSWKEE